MDPIIGPRFRLMAAAALTLVALAGCQEQDGEQMVAGSEAYTGNEAAPAGAATAPVAEHAEMFRDVTRAVAHLRPTAGNDVRGTVTFSGTEAGVTVVADITGLEPGSTHGFHIHEFGDMTSSDGTAAGGHYAPEGHQHGLPPQTPRHAGDLGNLEADQEGRARLERTVTNITVAGLENPIVGRAVIVHARPDDGSQPTGDAGPRLAQGVIGIAEAGDRAADRQAGEDPGGQAAAK